MHCNRKELAEIFDLDVKTIDVMVRKGMPYLKRPGQGGRSWLFDTVAVFRWRPGTDTAEKIKEAKRRLRAAKAGLREYELAEKLGVMVSIYDVIPHIEAGDAIVKSRLMALPSRLAHATAAESDPTKVQSLIEAEIDEVLAPLELDWRDRG